MDSLLSKVDPDKWSENIGKRIKKIEETGIAKSDKTLRRLQRQEERIYRTMLSGKDSLLARRELVEVKSKYETLQAKIKGPLSNSATQYIPKLDTLNTALRFLDQNGAGKKVKDALNKTETLQSRFQQAEDLKKFISERRRLLKDQLEKLGLVRQLKKYNKEVYYYSNQIKEYKELLHDSKRVERKGLEILSKTKLFQEFMRKNSMLASLFRLPGDGLTQANLAGLQTRVQVNNLIQQQITGGGPAAMSQFRQNMQSAQNQVDQLKNKIIPSGGSTDDIMPEGFRPNNQKTKNFLRRLELGTNIQSQKPNGYFPVTSDLGLSVGYKLNDKSIIGVGASYKIGWGQSLRHIDITNQGAGLRSFLDWKMKGSFWITGGFEMNFQTEFSRLEPLRNLNAWQRSGLLGLSKVIDVKTKFFKKTKLQLLWDFLSYEQVPRTQPIVFRAGYNF